MSEYNFEDVLLRLHDKIGSYPAMSRVCRQVRPTINDSYWQRMKEQIKEHGSCKISAPLVLILEEASQGQVKRQEMRPDVFLTLIEQEWAGIIKK